MFHWIPIVILIFGAGFIFYFNVKFIISNWKNNGKRLEPFPVWTFDFDKTRIEKYLNERNFELENIKLKPFAIGWFGSNLPIYEIKYTDSNGNSFISLVKTGFFAGVYLSETKKLL